VYVRGEIRAIILPHRGILSMEIKTPLINIIASLSARGFLQEERKAKFPGRKNKKKQEARSK